MLPRVCPCTGSAGSHGPDGSISSQPAPLDWTSAARLVIATACAATALFASHELTARLGVRLPSSTPLVEPGTPPGMAFSIAHAGCLLGATLSNTVLPQRTADRRLPRLSAPNARSTLSVALSNTVLYPRILGDSSLTRLHAFCQRYESLVAASTSCVASPRLTVMGNSSARRSQPSR
jgi:hypothetical protein